MPHFAQEPIADDPEQLERLRVVMHGPNRQSGSRPRCLPTLEARFPTPSACFPPSARSGLRAAAPDTARVARDGQLTQSHF